MTSVPTCAPALPARQPTWDVGTGGWDTHAHVFGPAVRFPYSGSRRYTPPDQTTADYVRNLDTLGLRHGVLVQPSVYGSDNSAILDALAQAPGRLRGVVELDAGVTDRQLADWGTAGVCGVRLWWDGLAAAFELDAIARRLSGTGWHLDIYCTGTGPLAALAPRLDALQVPVVIEAMGTPSAGEPLSTPGFQALLALLHDRAVWAKLSHAYKVDGQGLPYERALPFARALAEAGPTQLVWGSDWPHPNAAGPMPDDGALLDLLPRWVGSEALAREILTTNPTRLYGAVPGAGAEPPTIPSKANS